MLSDTAASEHISIPITGIATEHVVDAVRDHYGLEIGDVVQLGGEVDLNLRVQAADGSRLIVKISAGHQTEEARWQEDILEHLESTAPKVPAPRLVRSIDGSHTSHFQADGQDFTMRIHHWIPGAMLAEADAGPAVLRELGVMSAQMTQALASFTNNAMKPHAWDMRLARETILKSIDHVPDGDDRARVRTIVNWFDQIEPLFAELPAATVHHDLNDFNVLVVTDDDGHQRISGILDLNDALSTIRVADVAIAAGYAMLRREDPASAAAEVVAGFHSLLPLTDAELSVVYPLAVTRLCLNATVWTRRTAEMDHEYGDMRMKDTWPAIRHVATLHPSVAEARIRHRCGLEPSPRGHRVAAWLELSGAECLNRVLITKPTQLDLGPDGDVFDDLQGVAPETLARLSPLPGATGFTAHLSPCLLHAARRQPGEAEPCTLQVGIALHGHDGVDLHSPLPSAVDTVDAAQAQVVLRHTVSDGQGELVFWSEWDGIDAVVPVGAMLAAGTFFGTVATGGEGLQVRLSSLDPRTYGSTPTFVRPSERAEWRTVSPDPAALFGVVDQLTRPEDEAEVLVARRENHLARSQRSYYRRPMRLVRGSGVWLYDEHGQGYLDAINNVTHVGHANPRVASAVSRQMHKLNTNSRFLYRGIAQLAERLTSTLPDELDHVFFVCTGSEANDLAMRMSRQVTGRQDVVVIDGAYHGNTTAVMDISPNRYKGPGGSGTPELTHEVMRPDRYRGPFGYDHPAAGAAYAQDVADVVARLEESDRRPAAFIAESLMGTAGNFVFPDGYLAQSFAAVRAAGGLCVSDEVQVGFGRLGEAFWGFEIQGVVPDIVTMGKPFGNGHPLAAVVTTGEIAKSFDNGMKYFNTFGGNPVSCAAGLAVLDILEEDGLQEHARTVGAYFLEQVSELQDRHEQIGDVRGQGLYLGIELVTDRASRQPATAFAGAVSERMKELGVIVYPNGLHDHVLKLKPPMVFRTDHVDLFVSRLDEALSWAATQRWATA